VAFLFAVVPGVTVFRFPDDGFAADFPVVAVSPVFDCFFMDFVPVPDGLTRFFAVSGFASLSLSSPPITVSESPRTAR
jgi:hypothetical protein